jgi:BirA family transcriptional regulator, biotin operon repressor / biotin---[acetyl-CoA-carboxylase] ligase
MTPPAPQKLLVKAFKKAAANARASGQGGDLWVSGAHLADEAGLTRAALWKHVQSLEAHGWRLDSQPGAGYRLVAAGPRLTALELEAALPDGFLDRFPVFHRDVTGSTNDDALQAGLTGEAPHGSLFTCEHQTHGRGRMGRAWQAGDGLDDGTPTPAGADLALSFLLRPDARPEQVTLFTLAAALAVHDAVAPLLPAGFTAGIKWPNDLLVRHGDDPASERKVAGLLAEMQAEPQRVRFVVIGLGINVNGDAGQLPDDVRARAAFLKDLVGHPLSRADIVATLWPRMLFWTQTALTEPAAVREQWIRRSFTLGRSVRCERGHDVVQGTAVGIDASGALQIAPVTGTEASKSAAGRSGEMVTVTAADVVHLRATS